MRVRAQVSCGFLLAIAVLTCLPVSAQAADNWRTALIIGSNVGVGTRPALRFAEEDARKFGRVLVELGGFREEDVRVLSGPTMSEAMAAVSVVRDRIAKARQHIGYAMERRAALISGAVTGKVDLAPGSVA